LIAHHVPREDGKRKKEKKRSKPVLPPLIASRGVEVEERKRVIENVCSFHHARRGKKGEKREREEELGP